MILFLRDYAMGSELMWEDNSGAVMVLDPHHLDNWQDDWGTPSLVIVSSDLSTDKQVAALSFAYKVTRYKEGVRSKVVMA